ncbi:MAG: 30S ribosomal protein S6 [Desulfomonilaceae bacterium]
MRRYESVIILDPDLPDDDIQAFTNRYTELIRSYGGDVIKVDDWGLKRLAYLVKKREKGRYVFFDYAGVPELIHEMERQFKIAEEVIKFLSIKLDQDLDLEAFKAEAEAKAAEAAPAKATPVQPAAEAPIEEMPAVAAPEDTAAADTSAHETKAESGGSEIPTTESAEIKTEEPKKEVEP